MLRTVAALALGLSGVLHGAVPQGSIDEFIDSEMPISGVPGLAYAVVADGEITETGARGVMRKGDDAPVTVDTPFVTGSISKSFTALAVMQLVEAGDIDLDAAVSQHIEGFRGGPGAAITVRQLLSHTSGYSTLQGNASHVDATGDTDELARQVDGLTDLVPAYGPGERWEYSNTNYQILGRLIEVVTGQEYQRYVEANILEPLGMEDSFVADGDVHPEIASGHTPWFWTKRPLLESPTHRPTAPQGGVVASAADLALYLQAMLNGEDDVLSAEGKAQMMRPASAVSSFYGLGWFIDTDNRTVWHSGSSPGVETLATMLPVEDKAVVVLVNGGSGVGFGETTELRTGITARALGLDHDGEGSRWSQQALFISLALLPFLYLASSVWAWRHRAAIRAKSGAAGIFSLWFPLLTTGVAAWVIVWLVPTMMGAPLATLRLFQPDLALSMVASAIAGVLWALFRLGVAYTGRTARA